MHDSYRKSDVRAVVERVVSLYKCLRGLELSDVQRVVLALLFQQGFGLGECRCQEGIAVAGKYDLPGLEVECYDRHELLGYGESVDDGIGDVLILHVFQHSRDHHLSGWVVRLTQL